MALGLSSRKAGVSMDKHEGNYVGIGFRGRTHHRLSWLSMVGAIFTSSRDVQIVDKCMGCEFTEIWDRKK